MHLYVKAESTPPNPTEEMKSNLQEGRSQAVSFQGLQKSLAGTGTRQILSTTRRSSGGCWLEQSWALPPESSALKPPAHQQTFILDVNSDHIVFLPEQRAMACLYCDEWSTPKPKKQETGSFAADSEEWWAGGKKYRPGGGGVGNNPAFVSFFNVLHLRC